MAISEGRQYSSASGVDRVRLGRYRFSPGLVPSLMFLVLMVLLLSLANWQWHRAGEKQRLLDAREAQRSAPPLVLNDELPDPERDRFRPAVAQGRYLGDQQWLLDNRVHGGRAGYHVFSLFRTTSGRQLLVNRGWVSVGEDREFLPSLPLPDGEVTLRGHLDRPESVGLVMGEPPLQSLERLVVLQSLDVTALSAARGLDLMPLTLVLDGGQPGALEYDWAPVAVMGPERHLGYAVQWLALAVALLIIYVGVNTRRIEPED